MFGRIFSKTSLGLRQRLALRKYSTESPSKKIAESAQHINASTRSAFNAALNLLPASVYNPLSKTIKLTSSATYYIQVFYNVCKIVLMRQGYRIPVKADFKATQDQLLKISNGFKLSSINFKAFTNLNYKSTAIVAGELASLFIIGEQIGRGKVIGYDA